MLSIDSDLGLLLHDATRLMRKRFNRRASVCGLSSAQWRLLFTTLRDGKITQARLADRMEIEPISVSRLVDRMEQAGWVTREADPTDRRSKLVVPTAQALAAHDNIRAMARDVIAEALKGVAASDRDRLGATLVAIISNLSEAEASDGAVVGAEVQS